MVGPLVDLLSVIGFFTGSSQQVTSPTAGNTCLDPVAICGKPMTVRDNNLDGILLEPWIIFTTQWNLHK
jgi:hypothetical protein